jgi:predicted ATPase/DNA-binding SARP family transcriptional activator
LLAGSGFAIPCGIIIDVENYDARDSAVTDGLARDGKVLAVSMTPASLAPVAAPIVSVQLLGGLRIERAGQPLRLPRRKVETLFAYLLLHREAHSREKLAALYWGDFPDARARASLRNALAVLRKTLGDNCLIGDATTIQINPAFNLRVDVWEFEKATDPWAAIALYAGELLPDCYDDWAGAERARLRTRYLDTLLQLTQQMRSLGEYERANALARQTLASDPSNEVAYQHLIFCLAAAGDRQAALDQYARCEAALRDELDAEPAPETRALYAWLQQTADDAHASAVRPTNLPIPLTSFIGRRSEIDEVRRLLTKDENGIPHSPLTVQPSAFRLLTLVGSGGSGKTRLAIESASELNAANVFRDGIWWVELAGLADPALVVQVVAKAVGLRDLPEQGPGEMLAGRLRLSHALLVLDNCEHLIGACALLVAGLLSRCPSLKILATSREPLGIDGESVLRVPALSVPPVEPLAPERLLEYEGVQLFVERARTHQPDFALGEQNAASVALICRRLEGIPLAIELAAARTRLLKTETIAARLDDRFQLLTDGSRAAPARHQTLRALIDWSYDLLSSGERILLQRLSVFANGFTLRTAEAVCTGGEIEPGTLLGELARLVDKSLISVNQQGECERYTMLETIRQYAGERLVAAGEAEAVRERHLDMFARFAAEAAPNLRGPDQVLWMNRLEGEHDNLRAALAWSQGDDVCAERAMQMAADLSEFWRIRQYVAEGRMWLNGALILCGEAALSTRARALAAAAGLAMLEEALAEAEAYATESLGIFRRLGDGKGCANALCMLGNVRRRSSVAEGERLLVESLALAREANDPVGIVEALKILAYLASLRGHDARARTLYDECLTTARGAGDAVGILWALKGMGCVALAQAGADEARACFEQVLALGEALGLKHGMAGAYTGLGEVARSQGNYRLAAEYYQASETLRDPRSIHGFVPARYNLGAVALEGGQLAEAEQLFAEGLRANTGHEDQPFDACFLSGFAGVACAREDFERAAILLGAAQALLDSRVMVLEPADRIDFERHLSAAQFGLAGEAFSRAWDAGRALPKEQAIALALGGGQ